MSTSTLSSTAAGRLPQYNGGNYDPITNPYGLAAGGSSQTPSTNAAPNYIQIALDEIAVGGSTYSNSSSSSISIDITAGKVFIVSAVRPYIVGSYIYAIVNASNWIFGQIAAWDGASQLTINPVSVGGSGTNTSWSFAGPCGPMGATGAAGSMGAQARTNRPSNTMLVAADSSKFVVLSGTSFTQTFDTAANLGSTWWVQIRNDGTTPMTLGITLDSAVNPVMYPGDCWEIHCNGSVFSTEAFTGTDDLLHTFLSAAYI